MDLSPFERVGDTVWRIPPVGAMRVPAVLYATEGLMRDMDDKVFEQITNVASLPGIVKAAYAMPDAHWGYGFPIGGVAAFDPDEEGVISAGGVGFDISCGVRLLLTGLTRAALEPLPVKERLADALFAGIPAGVGSQSAIRLSAKEMDAMLTGGAAWAVARSWGEPADLARIEEGGRMGGADPAAVSSRAKERQRGQMGTLGSGNHYLEVQEVVELFDDSLGRAFGLAVGDIVVSIHCGSRGLGHQIGTEFLRAMALEAPAHGIRLPDRELACAPLASPLGQRYLAAMRSAMNCAMANRQILTHFLRQVFRDILPEARIDLLYDVSHNTCKEERHDVDGKSRRLFVHRKGATRAFSPGHPDLPEAFRAVGQPVLIGGSMGTFSYILAGTFGSEVKSFSSACHGAGRAMSRSQAAKRWRGQDVVRGLAARGILVRSASFRGVAEEAPKAYKEVGAVVDATSAAGLARKVARLVPVVCVKG